MKLLKHTPRFDVETAAMLGEKFYGINAIATPLPSERDQNFLLSTESGEKFVLKVANALEDRRLLEAQNAILRYLATKVSFCQRIVQTVSGEEIVEVEPSGAGVRLTTDVPSSSKNFLRLLTYLPGMPLAKLNTHSNKLRHDIGKKLGQLDKALADFDHPALHREFHWDLKNALLVIREYAPLVSDVALREVIYKCADNFEANINSLYPGLRKSVIHGDANDYNVLVNEHEDGQTVTGFIDFGDVVHSYTVGDVAVALAYCVLNQPAPLAVAAEVLSAYHFENPLNEDEIAALYGLMLMRLCMSVCLAAQQLQQEPDNEYLKISQGSIETSLPGLAAIDFSSAQAVFAAATGYGDSSERLRQTLSARKRLLGRNLRLAYSKPLKIVRGSMQYLYDDASREYLDAYNNVAHVGHCHPRVVRAAQEQMATLNTNTRYLHDLILRYAEKLTSTLPPRLSVCFFVNSGSEANELALRLARAHTKARDLIVLGHAYHGNTTTLIDISPYKHNGPGGVGPPSWVHQVPLPDMYRGLYRERDPIATTKYVGHVAEVTAQLANRGIRMCGFICESFPSVAGQIELPPDYLSQVYGIVRSAGGVCIADEVQTGYGRIGTHFWGFQRYDVVPDIVVLGKPIGNGHPLGAVITTPEIAAAFDNGMEFFSTFGGNTVSCAIGLAVLNVVMDEGLQAHAMRVGNRMIEGLRLLQSRHEIIGDVRGSGMFLGVELVEGREGRTPATVAADRVVNMMREQRILLGTDGPFHNVLKIRPPMPFSNENADHLLESLDRILVDLA